MLHNRTYFGIGIFVGIIVATLFFQFFAPRYEIVQTDNRLIKQDKWSGNSWEHKGHKWEKITDITRNWKPVDKTLVKALNLDKNSNNSGNSDARMAALKKKYPVLEEISNEDIMERIKYVYAREIMVDLYFSKIEK
jgi:hypothetical protein